MPDGLVKAPGAAMYPRLEWVTSGLVGTLGVRIIRDSDGVDVLARQTSGIAETPATSGQYVASLTAPTTAGEYTILWDNGALTPGNTATEDLVVTYDAAGVTPPSGTDLCTVADVNDLMEKRSASTDIDVLIQRHITRISAIAPRRYRRDFAPRTALTRRVPAIGPVVNLAPYDLRTASVVTYDPDGSPQVLTTSQYALSPYGGNEQLGGTYGWLELANTLSLITTRSATFGRLELQILGDWGPVAVPADISYAAALTVASWLSRPIATANALESFQGAAGEVRPDKFGGFAIPLAAHMIFGEYTRTVIA